MAPGMNFVELANNVVLDCRSGTSVNVDISNLNEGWLEFDGNISGSAAINLLDTAGNEIDIYGNNSSWTGGLNVYGNSYVYAGTDTALGTGPLTFGNSSAATVYFETNNPSIGSLNDNNTAPYSSLNFDSGSPSQLTINQTQDGTYSGHISGNGSLVKSGTAALTLTGSNDYSNGTYLNQGTLVAGSSSALGTGTGYFNGGKLNIASGVILTNPLDLTNGGTLSGNGTIGSAITAGTGVIIAPGNSPGNLTFSAGLTLADGGTINFQVQNANGPAGTGYDLITVSGGVLNLTASSHTLLFNLSFINSDGLDGTPSNFNPTNSYSWMFATSNSAITGFDPNQFQLATSGTSSTVTGTFTFSESGDQHSLYINFSPVPEPSTYALLTLGLGIAVLPLLRRRRVR